MSFLVFRCPCFMTTVQVRAKAAACLVRVLGSTHMTSSQGEGLARLPACSGGSFLIVWITNLHRN